MGIVSYVKGSREELKKVVWPSRQEVIQHTAMVIVASVGVAIFLAGVDYILNLILAGIIS